MTRQSRPYRRAVELVVEVEHILGDRSPDDIARALGYTRPASVARALYRAGRPDLARPFTNADWAAYRAA